MKGWARLLLWGVVLLVVACAGGPQGPFYTSAEVPPLPPNLARIYFYRDLEPYESLAEPWISLNGERTTLSVPGGVSYRDVPTGEYRISVASPGLYPNQNKTVVLHAGETLYVKIASLFSWDQGLHWARDTFVVTLIGPVEARQQLAEMRLVSGLP